MLGSVTWFVHFGNGNDDSKKHTLSAHIMYLYIGLR